MNAKLLFKGISSVYKSFRTLAEAVEYMDAYFLTKPHTKWHTLGPKIKQNLRVSNSLYNSSSNHPVPTVPVPCRGKLMKGRQELIVSS